LIPINRDIANVWARYELLSDGKAAQYRTHLFSLIYSGDRWLIASVAYKSREAVHTNLDTNYRPL
jgi:hypothetical protein